MCEERVDGLENSDSSLSMNTSKIMESSGDPMRILISGGRVKMIVR